MPTRLTKGTRRRCGWGGRLAGGGTSAAGSHVGGVVDGGDGDNDDGLSVSEASEALEKLTGKSVDESTIQKACDSCGVETGGREMDLDEFTSVVRHLEEKGEL